MRAEALHDDDARQARKKKRRSGFIITGSGGVAVASLFKLAALFIKQLIIVNCAPRAARVFRM